MNSQPPRELKKGPVTTVPGTNTGRERAGSEAEPDRRPVTAAAGGHARRAALPPGGFWLAAGILFLFFFGAAAPAPLYGVYQAQWRFSATTLTAVFAVYALVLLVTLLVFGSSSDYLGRRRVIIVALAAPQARAGCSSPRTVSGCCSPPGLCRARPSAPLPARSARR